MKLVITSSSPVYRDEVIEINDQFKVRVTDILDVDQRGLVYYTTVLYTMEVNLLG